MLRKILIAFFTLCLLSCTHKKYEYVKLSGYTQGTSYHITYEDVKGTNYAQAIDSFLQAFSHSLSTYDSTSVISQINRNIPGAQADEYFIKVFHKSKEIYELSDGAFDITVAPLVNIWGFGPSGPHPKNDTIQIPALLKLVGMNKVHINGKTVVKDDPNIRFDVNAIAQGYSVDLVCEFLEKRGIKNYLVEIGGEVRAKGKKAKNELWRIGIDKPLDNNEAPGEDMQAIIQLDNRSISTSGNYRHFFIENGIKYAHTIDPKTGYPARSTLLSVSVLAKDCMTADGLATTFMVLGIDKSLKLLKKMKGIEVYFIYNDAQGKYQQYFSKGMKKRIIQDKQ
jgi:FAD:protein FMN transferase